MKRKLMLLLACLFVGIGLVTAQTQKVTGVVISEEDGQPVIGASVLVKGTQVGAITGVDGDFTLPNVPSSAKTLVISYIGMQTQEVVIKPTLKVVLKSDSQNLDEVVVTAMGIKRSEKSLGYAVSSVKGDEITKARESNVLNSLSGKIAGLQ
ncbi:SusC/RagA family TonB-linked outer membrane protein, partial [Bacteroides uniformis]